MYALVMRALVLLLAIATLPGCASYFEPKTFPEPNAQWVECAAYWVDAGKARVAQGGYAEHVARRDTYRRVASQCGCPDRVNINERSCDCSFEADTINCWLMKAVSDLWYQR